MSLVSSLFPVPYLSLAQEAAGGTPDLNTVYIGTYTKKEAHVDGRAAGIYKVTQDPLSGTLLFAGTVAEVTNPSFVKVSPFVADAVNPA